MSDKLEMPVEQFAEAVSKENARLNEHNEKLKGQTKLYFDAFNKATTRIEVLEAALREIRQSTTLYGAQTKARKALEGKDD